MTHTTRPDPSPRIVTALRTTSRKGRAQVFPPGRSGMEETVQAVGHDNVTARHTSTFEVTTDDFLTPAGDCILGINADRAPADFTPEFVDACTRPGATLTATVTADGFSETVTGRGHPGLTFDSARSLVARTSDYVDDRTVMIGADHAAEDFDRDLVGALADGAALTVILRVDDKA